MGADGAVVTQLEPDSVIAALEKMRGQDVDSVAICLLHSYLNPAHERAVMALVRQHAPGLSISASHQVMPEIREYERTSTTVVNAFVKPVVDTYLASVEEGIAGIGIRAPLMVMQSSGGIAKADIARAFPARCVESGPAAGAIGAAALGEILGEANIIAFDMGGTTAKACLIEGGEPRLTDEMAGNVCSAAAVTWCVRPPSTWLKSARAAAAWPGSTRAARCAWDPTAPALRRVRPVMRWAARAPP